jgi:hypothetical protein
VLLLLLLDRPCHWLQLVAAQPPCCQQALLGVAVAVAGVLSQMVGAGVEAAPPLLLCCWSLHSIRCLSYAAAVVFLYLSD